MPDRIHEGWYLMSTSDLETELARLREPDADARASKARRLTVEEALAYRNGGNLPDEHGRTLRLVLEIVTTADFEQLHAKRLAYEPDFHRPPKWRRPGSKPVNIVPLRRAEARAEPGPWWEQPGIAALEDEWQRTGAVGRLVVPGPYRGFVYKTVLALRDAGAPVTPDSVADSVARWVDADQAQEIRDALRRANAANEPG